MRIALAIPYQIYGMLSIIPITQLKIDPSTYVSSIRSLKQVLSIGPHFPSKNLERQ